MTTKPQSEANMSNLKDNISKNEAETFSSKVDNILSSSSRQRHIVAVIEAIEAVIEKRATEAELELEVSGSNTSGIRKIKNTPLSELIAIHDNAMIELRNLRRLEKKTYPKNLVFRFR